MPQSRTIARLITESIYCDSISQHLQNENKSLSQVIEKKDTMLVLAGEKLSGMETMNCNQAETIVTLKKDVADANVTIKQQRGRNGVLGVALVVVIVLAIL
jgi:hypothetical protein